MHLENLVIDAVDPQRLGRFWEAVVGGERLTDESDGFETRLAIEGGPVLGLGARRLDIGQGDVPWVVLADPEGIPCCVMEGRAAYIDTGPIAVLPLDSADPENDAKFWSWLTGWTPMPGAPRSLRHPSRRGPLLELCPEPAPKGTTKNRLHLDIRLDRGRSR